MVTEVRPSSYRWAVLIVLVLSFMVCFAYAFAITQPSVITFMQEFKIDLSTALLIMTALSIAAAIMSIPAGIITDRFGPKKAGLLSIVLMALGWFTIYVAPNFETILLGRALIGLGGVTLSIVGPPALIGWFPPREIGLAMGIWAIGMPLGLAWEVPFSTWLIESYGWRVAHLVGAIMSIVLLALFALLVKPGPFLPPPVEGKPKVSMAEAFKSFEVWKFSISILFLIIPFQTVMSTYQTWLTDVKGLDVLTAGSVAGLIGLAGIFTAPFSGWLSDKLGGRKKLVYIIGCLAVTVSLILFAYTPVALIVPITILVGFANFMPPPHMFGIPPTLVKPELGGTALGIIITFFYIAGIFGPLISASILASSGIEITCVFLAICSLIAALVALTVKAK